VRLRATAAVAALSAAALALPAVAFAHASLVRTVPEASRTLNSPPTQLSLTYTEAVEPRFAIVSVTDVDGRQVTAGRPHRAQSDRDTLLTPLRRLPQGWYLVFWRVISADGHPVRGAFTFAIGPNPGPAPQFVIPKLSETATTPRLLIARWTVYISLLAAIGIFLLRAGIARALPWQLPGLSLRPLAIAFAIALGTALVAIPVYLDLATAQFALRSVFDLGQIVPLARASRFGRALINLELVTALFGLAAIIAIVLDRPIRERRTVAQLVAVWGAVGAAAALLLVPGLAGHPSTTSPRGLTLLFDWLHLVAGSVWVGGLIGLLVLVVSVPRALRIASLGRIVPRFSRIAFASVVLLVGSGIGASLIEFPTLGSLLDTSYGKALDLKLIFLGAALLLAGVNLARTKPRLEAALLQPALGPPAAGLLRRLVASEIVLVLGALFGASLLTSLAPPPKALAKTKGASAKVGPGPVDRVVQKEGYRLQFRVQPNRAAVPNTFGVRITRDGQPVEGADVTATFSMLDMEMGQLAYRLPEQRPGYFARSAPALVMVGHWGLSFDIRPPGASPFNVLLLDRANG
jgi:copper transport protein